MNKLSILLKNKEAVWNIIGVSCNAFYSLLLVIFITRMNGIEASGQFSFAFYVSSIAQTIGNYGGRIYQISDVSGQYKSHDYVSLKYVTSAIMLILSFLFCLLNQYSIYKIVLIIILVGYRFFESVSESYYGVLQKNNKLEVVGKSMTYKVIISVIGFIVIDSITSNIELASFSFLLGYALITYFYDKPKAEKHEKIHIQFGKVKKLLMECFKVFAYTFLYLLILNVTRYFVDLRLGDAQQGIFSILVMPASIIALFAQFIMQPMATSLVNQWHTNLKTFVSSVNKMIIGLFGLGVIASIGTYFIGTQVLSLVYGINFTDYKTWLALIVLSGIFSGITSVISNTLVIMRKLNSQMICYLSSLLITIVISYIFVNVDATYAILAYLFSMLIQVVLFIGIYSYHIIEMKNKAIRKVEK